MKERWDIHTLSTLQCSVRKAHKYYLEKDPLSVDAKGLRRVMYLNRKKLASLNRKQWGNSWKR